MEYERNNKRLNLNTNEYMGNIGWRLVENHIKGQPINTIHISHY